MRAPARAGPGLRMRREDNVRAVLRLMLATLLPVIAGNHLLAGDLPAGFVHLDTVVPAVVQEMRYYTDDNFTGRRVAGYHAPACILTRQAAAALQRVAAELDEFGLGLKVYDCYRPQRAVDDFVRWAGSPGEQHTKASYYPDVDKARLIPEGYIARRSGHSRGSTVDLTLVAAGPDGLQDLDMGSGWDYFGPESWPDSRAVTPVQRAHRMLLRELMMKHGFTPLQQEWWHFTLRDEPYPDRYFDFPVL